MSEELQDLEELADYQAMKSRLERIKAILAEKDTGPEVEKPVKRWWEEITRKDFKLVVFSLEGFLDSAVTAMKIEKIENGFLIYGRPGVSFFTQQMALVKGHEYRAYERSVQDWPNLDDTEGLE